MRKYKITFTDPQNDEQNIIVAARGECGAVHIAESMVDICESISIEEVAE